VNHLTTPVLYYEIDTENMVDLLGIALDRTPGQDFRPMAIYRCASGNLYVLSQDRFEQRFNPVEFEK
jgi:hypothetical protein